MGGEGARKRSAGLRREPVEGRTAHQKNLYYKGTENFMLSIGSKWRKRMDFAQENLYNTNQPCLKIPELSFGGFRCEKQVRR